MKKVNLLGKINYIFDRKQKIQLGILGVMIFIGGLLETLGVGAMIPLVNALLMPEKLQEYIDKYEFLQRICDMLNIESVGQVTKVLLLGLMAIYVVKNLYVLFLIYRQNSFITQNRNKMISRVMAEFLNRPYEKYLGADIPTVFRITDSDIPQTFALILAMLQLASEVVVSFLIFLVLLWQDVMMTLFIITIFGVMTLIVLKVLKPRLNKIGAKNQAIQSRIAKWRIQATYGLKDVKVLVLGQDPYHNDGQAHGLCFSVKPDVDIPPSLVNIYQELHDDLGCYIPNNGYLTKWAEQGVLMLNTVLTVRAHQANSHRGLGWEEFTDAAIMALNAQDRPIVYILWGTPAQRKERMLNNPRHLILKAPHPSPFSAARGFFGSRPFSQTNAFLEDHGLEPIDWQIE